MKQPPKWSDVYPQGTPQGDDEQRFFIALSRNKKYEFLSIAQISKESHLSKQRVEEIIQKYFHTQMVIQNPENEDQWGYWERCSDFLPSEYISIADEDKKRRILDSK
jgi:hypothetical protein